MVLTPGVRLGPYEVTAQIGAGGMGEVYHARDARLDRDVALKVLPEAFTADPERLARFEREAKVLASLNHPNIGGIYGLEDADGVKALVLELVEGPTLADLIAGAGTRGRESTLEAEGRASVRSASGGGAPRGLSLDEALPIAHQIAEALEAAHEAGVVHRDLKPANIKLRPDGTVKVLDFGLAKALEPAGTMSPGASQSPTITTPAMTQAVILGTAAYMSPEQAKGRPVDKRTDIWAFGAVLFEMLTGRRPFEGDDVGEVLAAVIRAEPDWTRLSPATPPAVRRLLRRCLVKDSRRRLSDIADARLDLDDGRAELDAPIPIGPGAGIASGSLTWWQRPVTLGLVGGPLVILAGLAGWSVPRPVPAIPRAVARLSILLTPGDRFAPPYRRLIALSPDGSRLAYTAGSGLYLRHLAQEVAERIGGTDADASNANGPRAAVFSPDGAWIAYWADGQVWKVDVGGGTPVGIADIGARPNGLSWGMDDAILYGLSDGIWRIPAAGGTPERVIVTGEGEEAAGPQLLPDGRSVLFTLAAVDSDWDEAQIVAQSLESRERTVLVAGGRDARYLPTGHLVYARGDALLAVRFDPSTLRVAGGPVSVVDGLAQEVDRASGAAFFDVSRTGTLAYVPSTSLARASTGLAWVDRAGNAEPLRMESAPFTSVTISPDGSRAALGPAAGAVEGDVWTYDLLRGVVSRLTFDEAWEGYPVWTPDGASVVFSSSRDGNVLLRQAADGTGVPERLTSATDVAATSPLFPYAISPEGRVLLFAVSSATNSMDLMTMPLEPGAEVTPLLQTRFDERRPALSPDGRWLAYRSNESGQPEIYVRPFPDVNAGKWQVSTGGGDAPAWSADGRELFYVRGDGLMSASVVTEPRVEIGPSDVVFESNGQYLLQAGSRGYAPAPDGRFLVLTTGSSNDTLAQQAEIRVVLNWHQELLERVPVP